MMRLCVPLGDQPFAQLARKRDVHHAVAVNMPDFDPAEREFHAAKAMRRSSDAFPTGHFTDYRFNVAARVHRHVSLRCWSPDTGAAPFNTPAPAAESPFPAGLARHDAPVTSARTFPMNRSTMPCRMDAAARPDWRFAP